MHEQPILSIIVPVYNVERYLNRCMETLVNQTLENIEIVLVDDGSEDESGGICENWAEKDNRIKVIHKKNEGLGFARNSGLAIASGIYVGYVDSDDYIAIDAFERVVKRLEETNADVCYYGCIDVRGDGKSYGNPPEKLLYKDDETMDYVRKILGPKPDSTERLFGGVSAWSGIARLEFIRNNNILFPSERECLCEDVFYNLNICLKANAIAIEPTCLYYYCHNQNSLTMSYRKDRFEAALRMYEDLKKTFADNVSDPDIEERTKRAFMQNLIVCIKQEIVYKDINGKNCMRDNLRKMCEDAAVKEVLNMYPINAMKMRQRLFFNAVKKKWIFMIYCLMNIRIKRSINGQV